MDVAARREDIARALGEDPTRMAELRASVVDQLVREGVLVRVHIGRWRATHKLSPEDLGLDPEASARLLEQVNLGWKLLLPREILEQLEQLESRGRSNLERHTLDTVLGPFMPANAFRRFKAEHEALRTEYFAIRDRIIERLGEYRLRIALAFRQAASDLYDQVRAHASGDPETFIDTYVERVMAKWPTPERIRDSWQFEHEVTYIPLSSELAAEETRRAEVVRDAELRAEVARHIARRQQEELDGFLTDVARQLRSTVYKTVSAALLNMQQGKPLTGRTVNSLRALIDRVRMLNVHGDTDIESQLRALDATLGRSTRKLKDIPQAKLQAALVDLEQTCQAAVSEAFSVDPLLARFSVLDLAGPADAAPGVGQLGLQGVPA